MLGGGGEREEPARWLSGPSCVDRQKRPWGPRAEVGAPLQVPPPRGLQERATPHCTALPFGTSEGCGAGAEKPASCGDQQLPWSARGGERGARSLAPEAGSRDAPSTLTPSPHSMWLQCAMGAVASPHFLGRGRGLCGPPSPPTVQPTPHPDPIAFVPAFPGRLPGAATSACKPRPTLAVLQLLPPPPALTWKAPTPGTQARLPPAPQPPPFPDQQPQPTSNPRTLSGRPPPPQPCKQVLPSPPSPQPQSLSVPAGPRASFSLHSHPPPALPP